MMVIYGFEVTKLAMWCRCETTGSMLTMYTFMNQCAYQHGVGASSHASVQVVRYTCLGLHLRVSTIAWNFRQHSNKHGLQQRESSQCQAQVFVQAGAVCPFSRSSAAQWKICKCCNDLDKTCDV